MFLNALKPVLIACIFASILAGCSISKPSEVQSLFGYSMGTSYSVKVVGSLTEVRNLQLGVEGVLSDINNRMSTYLPNSDLSKFGSASINTKIKVDEKTIEVVKKALAISQLTEGAFDPTVAPLVDLWGFGPTAKNKELPKLSDIDELLAQVGYEDVHVDEQLNSLYKTKLRSLDLSAIAKGYAVDEVAHYIEQKGFTNYLVEVGGEMKFSGTKPQGEQWRIAIEKPVEEERTPFRLLNITEGSVATSGDYRNYFEIDGKRYSHTLDPSTGFPVEHQLASVTVFMDSCMEADAMATAMLVLGREDAMVFAERLNIAVYLIFKDGDNFKSVQSSEFTRVFGLDELS